MPHADAIGKDPAEARAELVLQVVLNAGGWERRVVALVRKLPLKLALLVDKPPHQRCLKRAEVAQEVLALKGPSTSANVHEEEDGLSWKLGHVFRAEL